MQTRTSHHRLIRPSRRGFLTQEDPIRLAGALSLFGFAPPPGEHVHAAQVDSLLFTQGAFGALARLLGGFFVLNRISAMLLGQVREIGVMKAIGASGGQVGGMYLVLALVPGALASAITLPVAYGGGTWYAALKAELLNFDIAGFRIPWWSLTLQGAVGLLLPVCAAAIPVRHGCRISVSRAVCVVGVASTAPSSAPPLHIAGLARPLSVRPAAPTTQPKRHK